MPSKHTYKGTIPQPTIKKGSKGEKVKQLQKFLNWYGNYKLVVDGIDGAKTTEALKAFQRAEKLTVDGIYGSKSYNAAKAYKYVSKADKIVEEAKALAWAYGTPQKKWDYKTGAPKSVCKKAMNDYGFNTMAKQSDCGNFASTVVRKSGVDKEFKALHGVKTAFPSKENKFNIVYSGKKIPNGFLKAGDIVRYKKKSGQHALIYMGNNRVAEARHFHRFGNIYKDEKRYNGSNVKVNTIQVLRVKE